MSDVEQQDDKGGTRRTQEAPFRSRDLRTTRLRARLLTLLAPGLGHLYLGATWRAFFIGLPFLLLTHLFLNAIPATSSLLVNLIVGYGWYLLWYQLGAQMDLMRLMADAPGESLLQRRQQGSSVVLAFLFIYAVPISVSTLTLVTQRVGVFSVAEGNAFPIVRPGEWLLYRRNPEPSHGDLVVFRHRQKDGDTLRVARVIGLPGDRVRHAGVDLELNSARLQRERLGTLALDGQDKPTGLVSYHEQLVDKGYLVFHDPDVKALSEETYYLSEGQHYLLCDNRDAEDCTDSRRLGAIAAEDLVGTPSHVLWSANPARIGFTLFSRASIQYEGDDEP
jgi:signal peptidase I